jgi:hypothetical protein
MSLQKELVKKNKDAVGGRPTCNPQFCQAGGVVSESDAY